MPDPRSPIPDPRFASGVTSGHRSLESGDPIIGVSIDGERLLAVARDVAKSTRGPAYLKDDAVQDVVLSIIRRASAGRFPVVASFRGYVAAALRKQIAYSSRIRGREQSRLTFVDPMHLEIKVDERASVAECPDETSLRLPQRMAETMRQLERGSTNAEMAAMWRISVRAVQKRVKKLRHWISLRGGCVATGTKELR